MIEVRRIDEGSLDELVPLFEAYRAFYDMPPDEAGARAFLQQRLTRSESVIFIATLDGRALGFTQLYPLFSSTRMARMFLLNDLFVDGAARGTGLGAALLERARQHAQEEGACELMLETGNDNPARRLYERSGYQAVTTRTFYTRDVGKA
jgi:GNAT superfamily N-acetyltransferase